MNGTGSTILMLVLLFGMMYFLMIRPQKKQEQEKKELMGSLEVGDSVLTVSGFYGVIVDTVDDSTIIVEF